MNLAMERIGAMAADLEMAQESLLMNDKQAALNYIQRGLEIFRQCGPAWEQFQRRVTHDKSKQS